MSFSSSKPVKEFFRKSISNLKLLACLTVKSTISRVESFLWITTIKGSKDFDLKYKTFKI